MVLRDRRSNHWGQHSTVVTPSSSLYVEHLRYQPSRRVASDGPEFSNPSDATQRCYLMPSAFSTARHVDLLVQFVTSPSTLAESGEPWTSLPVDAFAMNGA